MKVHLYAGDMNFKLEGYIEGIKKYAVIQKIDCTARQCSTLTRKFMECSIINPALLPLMKHLVFVQRQKALNFPGFNWSPHGSLASIGQHYVTTRVVHLPNRIETSLITGLHRSRPNHRIGPSCADRA